MQRILVAVDGSEPAQRAVEMAADMAIRYQAQVTVTHVRTTLGTGQIPGDLAFYEQLEHIYLTEAAILDAAAGTHR